MLTDKRTALRAINGFHCVMVPSREASKTSLCLRTICSSWGVSNSTFHLPLVFRAIHVTIIDIQAPVRPSESRFKLTSNTQRDDRWRKATYQDFNLSRRIRPLSISHFSHFKVVPMRSLRPFEILYNEAMTGMNKVRFVGRKIPNVLFHNCAIRCILFHLSILTEIFKVQNKAKVMQQRVYENFSEIHRVVTVVSTQPFGPVLYEMPSTLSETFRIA